jgi:poly-beta-1,6 N-acetyl-D-glucosamine synthase
VRLSGERKKDLVAAGLALIAIVMIGAGIAVYLGLMRQELRAANEVVRAAYPVMLAFLLLVMGRYFFLLWFSFLGHLEESFAEPPPDEPLVSIIVPAYNEGKVIGDTIRSLAGLDYGRFEIVVVDDGSKDGTYVEALAAATREPRVPVRVVTQTNGGKAKALNHGISIANGEFVLCVDGDSLLHPLTLRMAMRHFHDPGVGAVAGNIKVANRRNLITWMQAIEYVEGLNIVRRAQAFFHAVNIVPGPLGVFRKRAIWQVGGYPHDTFAEDCDLTLALLTCGWRIRYEPRAISYTEAPETIQPLLKQRYRWTRGMLQAVRKRTYLLREPGADIAARITLCIMIFDSLIWPIMNVVGTMFFLIMVALFGMTHVMVLWWLQLTLLDCVTALFCFAVEDEDLRIVPLSIFFRAGYILLIDLWKLPAIVEEYSGVSMTWNKLDRVGLVAPK